MIITSDFLKRLRFEAFDRSMWETFQGCESPVPFYAEWVDENDNEYLVILDGARVEVFGDASQWMHAVATCEDITKLP
jgi:hypothetical protein